MNTFELPHDPKQIVVMHNMFEEYVIAQSKIKVLRESVSDMVKICAEEVGMKASEVKSLASAFHKNDAKDKAREADDRQAALENIISTAKNQRGVK